MQVLPSWKTPCRDAGSTTSSYQNTRRTEADAVGMGFELFSSALRDSHLASLLVLRGVSPPRLLPWDVAERRHRARNRANGRLLYAEGTTGLGLHAYSLLHNVSHMKLLHYLSAAVMLPEFGLTYQSHPPTMFVLKHCCCCCCWPQHNSALRRKRIWYEQNQHGCDISKESSSLAPRSPAEVQSC